jgi:hypothetical protein
MSAQPATDPRLAKLYRLVDDLTEKPEERCADLVFERLFEAVDWKEINDESAKFIVESLFEAVDEDTRNALAEIADDEHRDLCSCCRATAKTVSAVRATSEAAAAITEHRLASDPAFATEFSELVQRHAGKAVQS